MKNTVWKVGIIAQAGAIGSKEIMFKGRVAGLVTGTEPLNDKYQRVFADITDKECFDYLCELGKKQDFSSMTEKIEKETLYKPTTWQKEFAIGQGGSSMIVGTGKNPTRKL